MIRVHDFLAFVMSTNLIIFWSLGLLILLGLGTYALRLSYRLHALKQQQRAENVQSEQSLRNHQLALVRDIQFISRSILAEQCEITEGVMRLHYLINALDPSSWENERLSAIRAYYEACAHMPILAQYKALSRKEQFKLDNERWRLEDEHKNAIHADLTWLVTYQFPSVTLLQ